MTLAHGLQLNCLPNTLKELLPMQVQPVRLDCSQFGTQLESQRTLFYLNSDAVTIFGNKILALKPSVNSSVCREGPVTVITSSAMNFILNKLNKTSQAIKIHPIYISFLAGVRQFPNPV